MRRSVANLLATTLLCWVAAEAAEPPVRALGEQDIRDLMSGAAITATRGRVKPVAPFIDAAVRNLVASGKPLRIVALEDVPDDWLVVEAGGRVGGGGAWPQVGARMKQLGTAMVPAPDAMVLAMQAVARPAGRRIDAVLRSESAEATVGAFQAAIAAGVPVVDACPVGRAVPELTQSVAYINGIPATPAALVSLWGDVVVIEKTVDITRYEDLARSAAVGSAGSVVTASTAMAGRDAKRVLIPGSLSREILYGRTVREARESGVDPVAALLAVSRGFHLFRGVVTKADAKGDRGFDWWDVELGGTGSDAGHSYRVWVQNENIVAWRDGVPDAMSPDLIVPLDPHSGEAMLSERLGGYTVGDEVVLVGLPASALWRTPQGIKVLGPRHFGFDFDYVPLEQLHSSSRTSAP